MANYFRETWRKLLGEELSTDRQKLKPNKWVDWPKNKSHAKAKKARREILKDIDNAVVELEGEAS